MDILSIVGKVQEVAGLLILILTGLIGISLMIPGDEPEKSLQKALDFLKKFSKK